MFHTLNDLEQDSKSGNKRKESKCKAHSRHQMSNVPHGRIRGKIQRDWLGTCRASARAPSIMEKYSKKVNVELPQASCNGKDCHDNEYNRINGSPIPTLVQCYTGRKTDLAYGPPIATQIPHLLGPPLAF